MVSNSELIEKRTELARKVNDLIGEEAFHRLYAGLTDDEFFMLTDLMEEGKVNLHMDSYVGVTIDTPGGYTSECFMCEGFEGLPD